MIKILLTFTIILFFNFSYSQQKQNVIKYYSRNGTENSASTIVLLEKGNYIDNSSIYFQNATEKILLLLETILKSNKVQTIKTNQILERTKSNLNKSDNIIDAIGKIKIDVEDIKDSIKLTRSSNDSLNALLSETETISKISSTNKVGDYYYINTATLKNNQNIIFSSDFNYSKIIPLKKNNSFGYVNSTGEIVIDYQFDEASSFCDNVGFVKKNGYWFFIDTIGSKLKSFDNIQKFYNFYEGKVLCLIGNHLTLLDTSGNSIDLYNSFRYYKEDLVSSKFGKIILKQNSIHNVFDFNGKPLYSIKYSFLEEPSDRGISIIRYSNQIGYFDILNNKLIVEPRYSFGEKFNFPLCIVKDNNGDYGLINENNFSKVNFGSFKIERINEGNFIKFLDLAKSRRKKNYFITTDRLECIEGNCSIN